MESTPRDYSAFDRLKLERKPVGVKFLPARPERICRIETKLAFCEMFWEAQQGEPFYVQKEDFLCVEPILFLRALVYFLVYSRMGATLVVLV